MAYRVGCISLGCEKNRVDAKMMMASLEPGGLSAGGRQWPWATAIVNTCGFIESAKQESIEEILELAKLKEEGASKRSWSPDAWRALPAEIAKELPEVNAVVGISANKKIAGLFGKLWRKRIKDLSAQVRSFPWRAGAEAPQVIFLI